MNPALRKKIFRKSKKIFGEKRTRELQHLPHRVVSRLKRPPFAKVGNFTVIDGTGFFINGWLVDFKKPVESISIDLGDGRTIDLDEQIQRLPRKDIESRFSQPASSPPAGFTVHYQEDGFKLDNRSSVYLVLKCLSGSVKRLKLRVNHARMDPLGAVKKILNAVPSNIPEKRDLFDVSYGPAIDAIWSLRNRAQVGVEGETYNAEMRHNNPRVSLVIPIYGRYDFIEYQLSQFTNDPYMHEQDVVYVVDDPRIHEEVRTVCKAYEKLYRFPFRVLHLERNMGFAGANNIGVAHAEAPMLLMLNSDVMPASSGWLKQMVANCEDSINTTVYGVRLVYEDESIQHDGMSYHSSEFVNNLWTNIHPGKGLPASMFGTSNKVDVEAVTGACILMTKSNFNLIGGFDENFILGDYEDSDLCMRCRKAGLRIKMFREVSMYHLERQSQSLVTEDRWKQELTYYNCWYHTRKWDEDIKKLKHSRDKEPGIAAIG